MAASSEPFAYVGCYTTQARRARGRGINVYRAAGPDWTHVQNVPTRDNPSFLSFDRTGRFLCAVHGDGTGITSFRIDPGSGRLGDIGHADTGGRNPVHLAFDVTNRFIVVPNYASGDVALLHFDAATGVVTGVADVLTLPGAAGPHRVEQTGAHPHHTVFDRAERFFYVPDKGLDAIFCLAIDEGRLRLVSTTRAREGAGPRHIAFHPRLDLAYVLNELDCTLATYRHDPETGALTPFRCTSALPDHHTGDGRAAELALMPSGQTLIASLRGADPMSVFQIDPEDGVPRLDRAFPGGGSTPRFFAISETPPGIFVANEQSDTILRHSLEAPGASKGTLCAAVASPSSILFRSIPFCETTS